MTLTQYLATNQLTLNDLANQCGTSASTILRVKDGRVAPSKRVARALWCATSGQVSPNDLYGLHHAEGHCVCGQAAPKASTTQQ
jgi:DNA-binding XRE family transcriptional regulator